MFDEPDHIARQLDALVQRVTLAVKRSPTLDSVCVANNGTVVICNASATEESVWSAESEAIFGSRVPVIFRTQPANPRSVGVGFVAGRGVGVLDRELFECGCVAVQISGDRRWQLLRAKYCAFKVHEPIRLDTEQTIE